VNQTGIARKVDDLGRIVLPVEMRRLFGIRPGDEMEISVDGGGIQLRKVEVRCVFCDGGDDLRPFRDKRVCTSCSSALTEAVG
jgi:transcriptional pleiotropic regulator of transition state genes